MMRYHHPKDNAIKKINKNKNINLLTCEKRIRERHTRNYRDCLTIGDWWERGRKEGGIECGGEAGRVRGTNTS